MPFILNLDNAIQGLVFDLNVKINNNENINEIREWYNMRLNRIKRDYELSKKFNSKEYRRSLKCQDI